jgi:hypothetical protein
VIDVGWRFVEGYVELEHRHSDSPWRRRYNPACSDVSVLI